MLSGLVQLTYASEDLFTVDACMDAASPEFLTELEYIMLAESDVAVTRSDNPLSYYLNSLAVNAKSCDELKKQMIDLAVKLRKVESKLVEVYSDYKNKSELLEKKMRDLDQKHREAIGDIWISVLD